MADARVPDPATPDARAPSVTAPSAEGDQHFESGWERSTREARPLRPPVPQSFQTRLTFAFMGIVALTLALVAPIVINRLDDYFRQLEEQGLRSRADATAQILAAVMLAAVPNDQVVVRERADGTLLLHPAAKAILDGRVLDLTPRRIAQADTVVAVGPVGPDTDGVQEVMPDPGLVFTAKLTGGGQPGQQADPAIAPQDAEYMTGGRSPRWGLIVTLSNPYTSRAATLANVTALLLIVGAVAFLVAVLVAA